MDDFFSPLHFQLEPLEGRAQAQSDVGVPGGLQVHHVRHWEHLVGKGQAHQNWVMREKRWGYGDRLG